MVNWRAILENPAAAVGVVRSTVIMLVGFGVAMVTPEQTDALIQWLTSVFALISLAFSGVSTVATKRQVERALYTPAPEDESKAG